MNFRVPRLRGSDKRKTVVSGWGIGARVGDPQHGASVPDLCVSGSYYFTDIVILLRVTDPRSNP
jgi:hypothetical protein